MNASQNSVVQRVFKGGSLPGDLVVLSSRRIGAGGGTWESSKYSGMVREGESECPFVCDLSLLRGFVNYPAPTNLHFLPLRFRMPALRTVSSDVNSITNELQ